MADSQTAAQGDRDSRWGPVKEYCSLDGVIIRIGVEGSVVPVHLRAGDKIHVCNTDGGMARRLASHIGQGTLRVWGDGLWQRESGGNWKLICFSISRFKPLSDAPLDEVVRQLREVEGSGWKRFDDPIAELMRLRDDPTVETDSGD